MSCSYHLWGICVDSIRRHRAVCPVRSIEGYGKSRHKEVIIPAAKKGAIGFTVEYLSAVRSGGMVDRAQRNEESIDVRTGAGNFLRGVAPNQNILAVE